MNILVVVLAFFSIFFLAYHVCSSLGKSVAVRDKKVKPTFKIQPLLQFSKRIVEPIIKSKNPHVEKYKGMIDEKLKQARIEGLDFPTFIGLQFLCGIGMYLIFLIIFELGFLFSIIFFIVGFFLPIYWIYSKIQARNRTIFRSLPDALDLLTLSIEAGLDFNAALNKYIEKGRKDALHSEFYLVQQEMKMGKSRIEALRSLGERSQHPALRNVIDSLVQAIELGSSIGPILQSLSQNLRSERLQMAEKLANEAPLKMLFPLVFFIFPTIFIVLFGSIILMFIHGGF